MVKKSAKKYIFQNTKLIQFICKGFSGQSKNFNILPTGLINKQTSKQTNK